MNLGAFMDPEFPIFSTTLSYLVNQRHILSYDAGTMAVRYAPCRVIPSCAEVVRTFTLVSLKVKLSD